MEQRKVLISAIAAMAENQVIGKNNQLIWRLPADLSHFKQLTTGHCLIMGRKTYESIGKPLPNRTNIIISRNSALRLTGCLVVNSLVEALEKAADLNSEIFIIGGAEIYRLAMPYVSRLYLTIVHQTFEGDAYFPPLDPAEWQEVERTFHPADSHNPYAYSFLTLMRR